MDTVSRRTRILGTLIATVGALVTIALLYGISSSAIPLSVGVGIAGANTTLMGLATALVVPRDTPGLVSIVLTSVIMGGVQYALSWVI